MMMSALKEALAREDYSGFSRIVNRIAKAIITGSYRRSANAWKVGEENESENNERLLKDYFSTGDLTKPYFEVLIVSDDPTPEQVRQGRTELRQLRRPEDPFIYEAVTVPSFEEAVAAVVMNADVQAVIIKDNFRFKSQFDAPLLRSYLEQHLSQECGSLEPKDYGVALARAIGKIRPELDVYLIVDGAAEKVASHLDSKNIRRIFYGIEDLMEIHLAILEGINQRYETPYFDNLKKYARRPIGTFHALPVARGKSVFNSHWIRDFGHFYGANMFPRGILRHDGRPGFASRADREHQGRPGQSRQSFWLSDSSSLGPMALRLLIRSRCRRWFVPATSCWSIATAISRITTVSSFAAGSRSTSKLIR